MNRYIEAGIMADASAGKRVLVVSTGRREDVHFESGGGVIYVKPNQVRGHSADVVVVDGWDALSEEQRYEIVPAFSLGELICA